MRSFARSGMGTTLTCRVATAPGRRRSRRWLRSDGWRVRVGSLLPRHRAGIRCGYVVRPIWTSQPVYQERPHPTEHDRPALPACHISAERGACEVRLHPASSEKLSPVAARPTGRRHCSSRRVRSSRPLTTGYHAMTSGDQMILSSQRPSRDQMIPSSQRPAGDQIIPSSPPPAPASATASRRGLRMSQGRSGRGVPAAIR